MKKFFLSLVVAGCTFVLSAGNFDTAMKNIDQNGEMIFFKDLTPAMRLLEKQLPLMVKNSTSTVKDQQSASAAVEFFLKLIDLQAFQAAAFSSKEISPGIFVSKNFICTNLKSSSILINSSVPNVPCRWQQLPANTRFAVDYTIDLGRIWAAVQKNIQSAPQEIALAMAQIDALKAQGMDPGLWFTSLSGKYSILICGDTPENVNFKVVIPDNLSMLSNILKGMFPPQPDNTALLPVPINNNVMPKIIYQDKSITIVSSDEMLKTPAKNLLSLPQYKKYNAVLPSDGREFMVINIPDAWLKSAEKSICSLSDPAIREPLTRTLSGIKPFSLVAVSGIKDNGFFSVIASDFSVVQAADQIYMQMLTTWLPEIQKYQADKKNINQKYQDIKNEQK